MGISNESGHVRLTSWTFKMTKVPRWVLLVFVQNENIVYSEDSNDLSHGNLTHINIFFICFKSNIFFKSLQAALNIYLPQAQASNS